MAYYFHKDVTWAQDEDIQKDQRVRAVMKEMDAHGTFTAIVMPGAKMTVVGENHGVTSPVKYMKRPLKTQSNTDYIFVNGGPFVLPNRPFRRDFDQPLLEGQQAEKYAYHTVGPTSLLGSYINIPTSQEQYYSKVEGDDGSFFWSGPSFKNPLDFKEPAFYFLNRHMQPTATSEVPGGIAKASIKYQRCLLVTFPDDTRMIFTYTSRQYFGIDLNHLRRVIIIFLHKYLGRSLADAQQAINLDGGPRIIVGWVRNREVRLLAWGTRMKMPSFPYAVKKDDTILDIKTMLRFKIPETNEL